MPVSRLKGSRQSLPTRSVYNPVGFDPIEVLPVHLHRYANHTRYFLHGLYTQRVFKDVKDEYVPLKAAYQQRRCGKRLGYKLGPRWEGARHQKLSLTTKPLLRSITGSTTRSTTKLPTEASMLSEQAETVNELMEEAFRSVGVTPTIKIKSFDLETQDGSTDDHGNSLDWVSQIAS